MFQELREELKPRQIDIDELNDLASHLALDGALSEQLSNVNLRWTEILVKVNEVKVRYSCGERKLETKFFKGNLDSLIEVG